MISSVDTHKAKQKLGWQAEVTMHKVVEKMIAEAAGL